MSFVVAGIMFFLSFVVGVVSFMSISAIGSDREATDNLKLNRSVFSAAAIPSFFSEKRRVLLLLGLSAICAVASFLKYGDGAGILVTLRILSVELVLLSAFIIDTKTHKIPNMIIIISLCVGALFLVFDFAFERELFKFRLLNYAAGLICCVVVFYVLSRLTKSGVGMGDVKLISAMGWLIGITYTIVSVLFALIICSCVSIFYLVSKKKNKNDLIPFGPFMFFGYIIFVFLLSLTV